MKLERIVALDHKSEIGTSLDDFQAEKAYIVVYGEVVKEDEHFLYVCNGACVFDDGKPEEADLGDFTAVLKVAIVKREAFQ